MMTAANPSKVSVLMARAPHLHFCSLLSYLQACVCFSHWAGISMGFTSECLKNSKDCENVQMYSTSLQKYKPILLLTSHTIQDVPQKHLRVFNWRYQWRNILWKMARSWKVAPKTYGADNCCSMLAIAGCS